VLLLQCNSAFGPWTLCRAPGARVIDQNPPHELCGHAEKMSAILPRDAVLADQTHVRLMNKRRRLKRVVDAFMAKVNRCPPAEFSIHKRHQIVARAEVTVAPREQ
jgi:hypothetical protein